MKEEKNYRIYIVLSQTYSVLARTIKSITHEKYSHISISFDENCDVCYENYLGELDIPVYSENPIVNELYKKLYSLEVVFGKYVDESGLEDLKNQIKYYASSIVSLKNNISEDMVLGEANIDQDYEKEFAM